MGSRASALVLALTIAFCHSGFADDKWQGQVPKSAERPELWNQLLPELSKRGMVYGALASARDMLNFFLDLPSKELAYQTIIGFIDMGYPFSTRADFVPGDIEPPGNDNFAQSYLLYKGIVNHEKKMEKWAEYYFAKLDKEHFPKYLFFQANEAYVSGKPDEAIALLKKALALTTGPERLSLAKKEARTLARIYYEKADFEKSWDIYQNFLLKLNPIAPSDWLEGAWNLFQLKQFPEALGLLYNMESQAGGPALLPEKYVLRGLVYREYCSVGATDHLIKSFNKEFGAVINGIKLGEPLSAFPQMTKIQLPEAEAYRQFVQTIDELEREAKMVKTLPPAMADLANYVYSSELAMLKRGRQLYEDQTLEALARHLVILGESLRFLKFDVAREKFSPDRVFAPVKEELTKLVDNTDEKNFRLHWLQWGDYWRDERMLYRGLLKSTCEH